MKLINKFDRKYDNLRRFISYHKQIDLVAQYVPINNNILEIGVGNKTVNNILKGKGHNITSIDILPELEPDYVGDVRKLPFKNNEFNTTIVFEVLEHLPYKDFLMSLEEIKRVTSNKILISLPYWNAGFEIIIKFPGLGLIKQPPILRPHLEIPYFFRKLHSKEHYWEIGAKGYPMKLIKKHISKIGKIKKTIKIPINNHHIFFVVEVNNEM